MNTMWGEFKVESDVSITDSKMNSKYPFGAMNVGDSFALPKALGTKVRNSASVWGTRHGMKFSIRRHGDGFRCWRIA